MTLVIVFTNLFLPTINQTSHARSESKYISKSCLRFPKRYHYPPAWLWQKGLVAHDYLHSAGRRSKGEVERLEEEMWWASEEEWISDWQRCTWAPFNDDSWGNKSSDAVGWGHSWQTFGCRCHVVSNCSDVGKHQWWDLRSVFTTPQKNGCILDTSWISYPINYCTVMLLFCSIFYFFRHYGHMVQCVRREIASVNIQNPRDGQRDNKQTQIFKHTNRQLVCQRQVET